MIENVSKKIIRFYQVSILVALCSTLAIIIYFWKLGFIDGSKSIELHKANFVLETYENKNIFHELLDLIIAEDPKAAIQKTGEIEQDFERVNNQVEVAQYQSVQESIQRLKTSAANIISFSKMDKVLSVFNLKMDKFYDYVKKNDWRTLTRMSDRIFSQTNVTTLNKNKLPELVNSLEREFKMMIKITEQSVLSSSEKSEITSRINNLQTEVTMLKSYAEERAFYTQLHQEADLTIRNWVKTVAPELTLQKLKVSQAGRYYIMGLLGILCLLTTIFFMSFLVNRYFQKKSQKDLEANIEILIAEGLVNGECAQLNKFSEKFQTFFGKMSDYFNKRMSFGSIFQDALPLSSILLDKNLKVLWSNKNFSRDWQISEEDMGKEYMSWDYLNKLTNIGSEDPVLEALKHGVAGIYQIQVKASEDMVSRPYEMFVSPVEYQGESKIMLFFYDLTNLEQTISDQAYSLITPIRKSFKHTKEQNIKALKELHYEFKVAGIEDIYDDFIDVNNKTLEMENGFSKRIKQLEDEINLNDEFMSRVLGEIQGLFKLTKNSIGNLKFFKDNVVALSGISHELDRCFGRSLEMIYANMNALKTSMKRVNDFKNAIFEMTESVTRFEVIKNQLKESRNRFYESNTRLSHEVSQISLHVKRATDAVSMEKLNKNFQRFLKTFEDFQLQADDLERKVAQLELLMSKTEMVFNSANQKISKLDNNFEKQQLQLCEDEVKLIKKLSVEAPAIILKSESLIIENLQEIFARSKDSLTLEATLIKSFPLESPFLQHTPETLINM